MNQFRRPAEGTWTEHYPHLGTGLVTYDDCVSPEFYADERDAVFMRAWLNVGRVEDVPRNGSYVTREIDVAQTSLIVVRGVDGEIRAFHNMCRHRGNKIVWNQSPFEETSGNCRSFTCKYHGWRYDTLGELDFVQQEGEFFDFDKADFGLVPVACEVFAGFIFVNLADEPPQSLHEFLGSMVTALDGYPFDQLTERYDFAANIACNWKVFADAFQEYYHVPMLHSQEATPAAREMTQKMGFEAPHYQLDGPHRMVSTSGSPRRKWPHHYQYPIELATKSGLFGPWSEPELGDELPGVNPGNIAHWQIANFQIFPNLQILVWETGWYLLYRFWPTGPTTHRFEGTLFFAPSEKASDRAARECAVVMFKEFALQDAGTLEGTQKALESPVSRGRLFPLNDQEILVRHLHHEVGAWVDEYRKERDSTPVAISSGTKVSSHV